MKKNIKNFERMKDQGKPITWITAYDLCFAQAAERAGIDMILVGDSGGMVQLGYETTNPVTMNEMISMSQAARRGAPNTFIVGDMPQGSYEVSDEKAVENAMRFVKEAACDAVKLEGGERVCSRVKAIKDAGIEVIGHLGLTPQSAVSFGGYKVQGKTKGEVECIIKDVYALQKAGVFMILLEAIPELPAGIVAYKSHVPIMGIGAGKEVHGQLVIMHDLMGFYGSFRPWFAKCYIPEVLPEFQEYLNSMGDLKSLGRSDRRDGMLHLAELAIKAYIEEVRNKTFPNADYTYPISKKEKELLDETAIYFGYQ